MIILKPKCHSKLILDFAVFQLMVWINFFPETFPALQSFPWLAVATIWSKVPEKYKQVIQFKYRLIITLFHKNEQNVTPFQCILSCAFR